MFTGAEWIPDNINNGHLEYFFILLAVIMFLNFLVFLLIARRYTYMEHNQLELPTGFSPDYVDPDFVPGFKTRNKENSGTRRVNQFEMTPVLSESTI